MSNQPNKLNILSKSIIFLALSAIVALTNTVTFAQTCAVPGKNGVGTLTGVINTYFPAPTTATTASGTSIPVGAVVNPASAVTPISVGDLLLIIQMQDATINTANTAAYGSSGTGGNGFTGGNAGFYEYVVATNAVTTAGGTIIATSPLSRTYNNDPNATTTRGKQTYQVIRVPQYTSATISGTVSAAAWDGRSGGLVVFDVSGNLAMGGGTINAASRGFRGGLGRTLTGGGGTNADYRTLATNNANGSKGEGIVGTQRYIWDNLLGIDSGVEGYPLGSYGRGAPGNAGGGATDGSPSSNSDNSGGGGGSNGGAGGKGGNSFGTNLDVGGRGGAVFTSAVNRIIMGGGGGAGSSNNNSTTTSSGARGGGIVLIRAGTVSGTGTINVNGENAQNSNPDCCGDGTGGGGAGGSIIVTANTPAGISGITATARGGNGGSVLVATTNHGPGGGGGGGVIMSNGSYGSTNVGGGTNGITPPTNIAYGAVSGSNGIVNTTVSPTSINGTSSGATCLPRITLTKVTNVDVGTFNFSGTNGFSNQAITTTVVGTGVVGATQTLTAAETSTVLTETIPSGWTLTSISCTGLGSGGTAINDLVAGTVTLNANATKGGTNIACLFTNTKLSPNLTISKTHSPTNFVRGSTGTYSLTVGNTGTSATSGMVTVTDTLPAGLAVNGGAVGVVATSGTNGANWTCNSNAATPQAIICTSTTAIATSGSSVFTFDVSVASNAAVSVTNSVSVTGGGESTSLNGNNSATDPTPTVAPTDLNIAKSHTGNFTVGTTGNYSLTVTNSGGVASSGTITVSDTLPVGLTVNGGAVGAVTIGGTNSGNWACNSAALTGSPAQQMINCTSTTSIATTGTSVFNFNVNVGLETAVGTNSITNSASISGGGEVNTANNTTTDPTTVLSPNLTLVKADTGNFTVGSIGTYQMTVGNSGTAATSGTITVSDILPTGLTVNGGAAGTVTTGGTNGANWTCNSNALTPQTVTCTSTALIAISGSSVFNFNVSVGLNTIVGTNALSNSADVSGGGEATANNGNNSSTDVTTVLSPNLTIDKSHIGDFTRGATGTYTLTIGNAGTAVTSGTITVSDTLPTGLNVNGGAAGAVAVGGTNGANWTCNSNAATPQVITCTSTTAIVISGSSVFTFDVNVAFNASATVTNTATISGGDEATANNGNNSDSDPTNTLSTPPNVVLVKSCPTPANCTASPQMPGTDLTYKIEFTNNGGQGAANMRLVDGIPINTDFKIGSATVNIGTTGLTFVIEYSSDYDPLNPTFATWGYTPVSGGGGASVGYDRNVKAIRWRVTGVGILSNVSPNNTGDISFVAKIR